MGLSSESSLPRCFITMSFSKSPILWYVYLSIFLQRMHCLSPSSISHVENHPLVLPGTLLAILLMYNYCNSITFFILQCMSGIIIYFMQAEWDKLCEIEASHCFCYSVHVQFRTQNFLASVWWSNSALAITSVFKCLECFEQNCTNGECKASINQPIQ